MDQVINMLLKGTTVELIVKLEPRLYRKYIWKIRTTDQCNTSN